jgi:predicted branched-subunit amino acid permease
MTEECTSRTAPGQPMWAQPEFREGARDMVGIALGIGAWGLVTGVAMVKSGMGLGLSLLMSALVFAGSAQLAAVPLIAAGAPIWVVWATALCINLRFVIFSAQWRPYFAQLPLRRRAALSYFTADLNYVLFMRRFPEPKPSPAQQPYFWGGVVVNAGSWHLMSITGILLGHRIPPEWGLAFAGTAALLGMTYSMLSDRATWLPALLAGCAAVVAYALPLKMNMLVAIAAAVAMGMIIDHSRPMRERLAGSRNSRYSADEGSA